MPDRRRHDDRDDERRGGGRRDRPHDDRSFGPRPGQPHRERPQFDRPRPGGSTPPRFDRSADRGERPYRPADRPYRPPTDRARGRPSEGLDRFPERRGGPAEFRTPGGFGGGPGAGRRRPDFRDRPDFSPRGEFGGRPARHGRPAAPARDDATGLLEAGEELVAGRHPVQEAFAARRAAIRLLVVPERRAALEALVLHATTLRIPVVEVEGGTLTSLSGFDGHQGVALVVEPRTAATIDDILALARQRGERPFVLVLDSLEDPQNLGTLLRSAEACGVHGVVYPARRAVPLTAAAVKASAGASEHLLLAPVADLAGAIADLRGHGLRAVGADQEAALPYTQADLRGPLALVVGSEGHGISGQLRRRLDMTVRIPMRGKVGSLNAAVAGSVLLFAAAEGRPQADGGQTEASAADDVQAPTDTPAASAADEPNDLLPGGPPPASDQPTARARARRGGPASGD